MSTESSSVPDPIAVIGLGAMGLPIALRLGEKWAVHGYDVAADRRQLAAEEGIRSFDSASAASASAAVVVLVVRSGPQLEQVLFGDSGIADTLQTGSTILLMSTIGLEAVRDVAVRLESRGLPLVDAPVSGGPVRARNGDLLVTVGGQPAGLVGQCLEHLASTLKIIGPRPGDGQAFKTVNQLLCGVHIAAAAEAIALARALGLDDRATWETLDAGAASSFMLRDRGARMLADYESDAVHSRVDIFAKDMGIVGRTSRAANLPTPLAAAAEQIYLLGVRQGMASMDDSTIVDLIAADRGRSS
ncbi:NAD(P)-dependent oxidoreductase [Mycolicibacterium vaccae]|uniref:6-phosphogluconate dehydrogenase n=1 Tax=Mycolicibacterium vaccae ATCC 25954 TaxID=1194972 RepID=K0UB06_MYCVA|nr:6-phosphogluconate dehydrogenase [Mycolicibacterium vaccae ATCC 25954]